MATLRQKKAMEEVVKTGGNVTEAMRRAGYSEGTLNKPDVLTKSKAWLELMDEYLPDEVLAAKHQELLNHEKGEVQVKALDMGYKLKGSYAPDKAVNVNVEMTIDNEAIESLANLLEVHERTNQPSDGGTTDAVDQEVQDQD